MRLVRTTLKWHSLLGCVLTHIVDAVFQGDTTNRTSCDHHRGPFHNFAIFTDGSYRTLAQEKPCPPGHPFCGPASSRPSRAIWWYGLLGGKTPKVLNASSIADIVGFCTARHVRPCHPPGPPPSSRLVVVFDGSLRNGWLLTVSC